VASRQEFSEIQRRYWRRSLLVGAGLVSIYFPLDLLHPAGGAAAAWRAGWVVVLLAAAALQHPGRPRLRWAASHLAAISSGIAASAVVLHAGGTAGPRFGFLQWLPLAMLLLLPHLPSVAICVAAGSLTGGAILVAREGRGILFAVEWGVHWFALCALAVLGIVGFRRTWISELEAQRARGEALAALADSEHRRARAERLALVGQLATGVAHEINNPLSFVKSSLQSLKVEGAAEERAEAVVDALQGIERISQIVGDLRSLVRDPEEGDAFFGVDGALGEAWRLASPRLRSVRAHWEAAPGLPQVRGSRRLLVQALVNLLANAVDAAEGAPDHDRRWVTARAAQEGGGVAISVDDGGPGLTPEVAAHLFERFFTTKGAKGTGLGLAMVREHVAGCGGTVEGANRPEGGARFTVWLPPAGRPDSVASAMDGLPEVRSP